MARYPGRNGVIYLSPTGTGVAVNVISMAQWNLDMSTDKIDVTAFGDANKVSVQGLKNVEGEISGFWDNADDSIFDGADSTDGVKLYLYPSSNAPTFYWYGPAWLDASIEVGVSDAVTVSGSFSAAGSWGRKP
jgi:hypothetical protein